MAPDHIANQSPGSSHAQAHNGSAVVQVRLGLESSTIAIVTSLVLIIGACGAVMGLNLARQHSLEDAFLKLDRQYRMTELKLDDWTVVAHRSGMVLPGDYTRGPQGNLDFESFKSKGK
jgi:hypothetical protein